MTHDCAHALPAGVVSYNISLRMLFDGKAGDTLVACPWRMASCPCQFCMSEGLQQFRRYARSPTVLPVASQWTYHENANRSNMWWDRASFSAAELRDYAARPPARRPYGEYRTIWDSETGGFVGDAPGEQYPSPVFPTLESRNAMSFLEGTFKSAAVIVAVGRYKRSRAVFEQQQSAAPGASVEQSVAAAVPDGHAEGFAPSAGDDDAEGDVSDVNSDDL